MILKDKNAVIYGGGGAVGGAVAAAFAREGARVFLAGRTVSKLRAVADRIHAKKNVASIHEVDALDELSVDHFLHEVEETAGTIDISFNAIGIGDIQGISLIDMVRED